jgi:hypothetical protein
MCFTGRQESHICHPQPHVFGKLLTGLSAESLGGEASEIGATARLGLE